MKARRHNVVSCGNCDFIDRKNYDHFINCLSQMKTIWIFLTS